MPRHDDELSGASEPCRPGAHSITLKKLYDEEMKLYEEVKVKLMFDLYPANQCVNLHNSHLEQYLKDGCGPCLCHTQ